MAEVPRGKLGRSPGPLQCSKIDKCASHIAFYLANSLRNQESAIVAERIRMLDSEPFLLGTPASAIRVIASIRVAVCPKNGKVPMELTRAADSMMYRPTQEGKNRVSRVIAVSDETKS